MISIVFRLLLQITIRFRSHEEQRDCDNPETCNNPMCMNTFVKMQYELFKKDEIIEKLKARCQENSRKMKRVQESIKYYKRRTVTLKNLLEDLKGRNLITEKAEHVLKVK